MQATTAQPTVPVPALAPAAAPAAATARPLAVTFTDVDGTTQTLLIPQTRQAIADLRARRSELSDQLTSAANRRHRLSEEIKSAPEGASRIGLEQRLAVLDKRIVQLESDIAATGRQLSSAPQTLTSEAWRPGRRGDLPPEVARVVTIGTMFILFPMALALARNIWRRGSKPAVVPQQLSSAAEQRLERLEQGVDAIAIEIERVAEGQRFVTRLLAEANGALKLSQGEESREKVPT
ncbi:MAG TPA: hypothetical protein VHM24_11610 [Gemmatimonadaceae bacterium]|nr:hypothetical protein [Gemmatimonadaceae bacterium]